MEEKQLSQDTTQQSFLHGAVIIMFGTFMAKFIGIFFRLVLGNIIGAEGNGYYSTAYSIYKPLYAMSVSGLPVALAKLVAEAAAINQRALVRRIFKVAYYLFVLVGLALTAVMLFFSKELACYMHNEGARFAIFSLAPVAFFCCVSGAYKGYYEGKRNMYPTAVSEIIEAFCKLVFGAAFICLGAQIGEGQYLKTGAVFGLKVASANEAKCMLGAAGAVCGIALSSVLGTLFLFACYHLQKPKGRLKPNPKADLAVFKAILSISVPICLGSVIFNISGNIDARTAKIGLEQAVAQNPGFFAQLVAPVGREIKDIPNFLWGGYGLSLPIYNFLPAMMVSFGVSLLPNLAAAWSTNNRAEVLRHVESSLRIANTLAFLAGAVVFANARSILLLVYAKRAADVEIIVPCLRILGVCLIFASLGSATNIMLQAIGRAKLPVVLMAGGVMVKYATNKLLVKLPWINIKGAALGTLCCYAFIAILGLRLVFRLTKIKPDLDSVFVRPLKAGVAALVWCLLLEKIAGLVVAKGVGQNMLKSLVLLGLAGVGCLAFVWAFKVIKEEDVLMLPKGEKLCAVLKRFGFIV